MPPPCPSTDLHTFPAPITALEPPPTLSPSPQISAHHSAKHALPTLQNLQEKLKKTLLWVVQESGAHVRTLGPGRLNSPGVVPAGPSAGHRLRYHLSHPNGLAFCRLPLPRLRSSSSSSSSSSSNSSSSSSNSSNNGSSSRRSNSSSSNSKNSSSNNGSSSSSSSTGRFTSGELQEGGPRQGELRLDAGQTGRAGQGEEEEEEEEEEGGREVLAVADSDNHVIRILDPISGVELAVAGGPGRGAGGHMPLRARLFTPRNQMHGAAAAMRESRWCYEAEHRRIQEHTAVLVLPCMAMALRGRA
eukprot:1474074-Rhodomonas_salina.5